MANVKGEVQLKYARNCNVHRVKESQWFSILNHIMVSTEQRNVNWLACLGKTDTYFEWHTTSIREYRTPSLYQIHGRSRRACCETFLVDGEWHYNQQLGCYSVPWIARAFQASGSTRRCGVCGGGERGSTQLGNTLDSERQSTVALPEPHRHCSNAAIPVRFQNSGATPVELPKTINRTGRID